VLDFFNLKGCVPVALTHGGAVSLQHKVWLQHLVRSVLHQYNVLIAEHGIVLHSVVTD